VKLFNLEMKDNDPMDLAFEIKAIMHDVDVTSVKIDISLATFIKSLYPTYSLYLESLQSSGQLKSLDFDSLVEKIVEREKSLGKNTTQPTRGNVCFDKKKR
jgi:hypothetical protein